MVHCDNNVQVNYDTVFFEHQQQFIHMIFLLTLLYIITFSTIQLHW